MQTDLCRGNVQPVRTGKCHVPCEKSSCTCNYFCSRTGWLGRVLGGYFALETERQKCVFFGVVRGSSVQTFLVLSQSKRPFSMDGPWGIGNCKHLVNTQAVMLGHDIRFSWSNKLNFEHVPFVAHVYLPSTDKTDSGKCTWCPRESLRTFVARATIYFLLSSARAICNNTKGRNESLWRERKDIFKSLTPFCFIIHLIPV